MTTESDPRLNPNWWEGSREYQVVALLGAILDKLEEIRCQGIDIETEVTNLRDTVRFG